MGVTVRKDNKSDNWYVHVCLRKRRKALKCRNKDDAEYIASRIRRDIATGRFCFQDPKEEKIVPTLSEYFEDFKKGHMKSLRPSSQVSYQGSFTRYIKPQLGSLQLNQITKKTVKNFVDFLKEVKFKNAQGVEKPLSKDSVRIIVACLRKILNEAVDDEIITVNPAARMGTRFRELTRVHEIDPFSEEEIVKFLQTASEECPYWFPYFACLFHAGLRPGEGVALRWADVDFKRRLVNIRVTGSGKRIGITKTGKTRQVEMSEFLHTVLQDLLMQRKSQWGSVLPDYVFCTSIGTMADICNIRDQKRQAKGETPQRKWTLTFSELLKLAELKPRGLHQFRHSFATIHLQNGTPIEWVSRQLGHTEVTTTYRHYYHYIPERQKQKYTNVLPAIGKATNNVLVMKAAQ